MREYQARYYEIAKNHPDLPRNVVDWPPCCPSEKAPAFPPDGYYASALAGNPQFAVELVNALLKAMCANGSFVGGDTPIDIVPSFNREPLAAGECGEVPGDSWSKELAFDGACGEGSATLGNYCDLYSRMQRGVGRLKTIRLAEGAGVTLGMGTSQSAYGQCGQAPEPACYVGNTDYCHAEPCNGRLTKEEALEKANTTLECMWDRTGSSASACTPQLQHSWIASDGTLGQARNNCSGIWATAYKYTCTNSYNFAWGDTAGSRRVFFRLTFDSTFGRSTVDSPYRDGNVLGLPIDYCRVNNLALPEWYCVPEVAHKQSRYESSVDFGGPNEPDEHAGTEDLGDAWVGENAPFYGSDCQQAGEYDDLPDGSRGWALGGVAGLLSPDLNTDPERGRDCGSECSTCTGGAPRPVLGSVDFSWSLGRTAFAVGGLKSDRSAGYVLLRVKKIPDRADKVNGEIHPQNVISPNRLIRNFQAQDATMTGFEDPVSHLLQAFTITSADSQIDVSMGSEHVPPYTTYVRTYAKPRSNAGVTGPDLVLTGTTEIHQVSAVVNGQREHTIRIHYFTPDAPGVTVEHRYWAYRLVGDVWTMQEQTDSNYAAPVRSQDETITYTTNGLERTTVRRVLDAAGTVVSKETTVEQKSTTGWLTTQHAMGDDAAEVRTYDAHDRLQRVVTREGNWTDYVYQEPSGELLKVISQVHASVPGSAESSNRVTEYQTFTNQNLDGDSVEKDVLKVEVTRHLGVVVETRLDAWCSLSGRISGGGTNLDRPVRHFSMLCALPEAAALFPFSYATGLIFQDAWRTSADRTAMTDFDNQPSADMWVWRSSVTSRQSSDGTASATLRYENSSDRTEITETRSGRYDASFALYGSIRAETRTVSVRRMDLGTTIRTDTYDESNNPTSNPLSTDSVHISGMLVDLFDQRGRVAQTRHWTVTEQPSTDPNATTETRSYGCCGLESQTDQDGITTTYGYDTLGRTIWTQTQLDASRSTRMGTVYDAAGNVKSETRTPYTGTTPATTVTLRSSTYDLAGRMLTSTDAAGNTTTYAETIVGNPPTEVVRTETLPNLGTGSPVIVTRSWPDGSQKSVGGPAGGIPGAHAMSYESGVEAPPVGGSTPLRFTKSIAANGTQWTKSYVNALGQNILTVYPDSHFEESVYDAKGDLVMRTASGTDGASVLSFTGIGNADRDLLPVDGAMTTVDFSGRWSLSVQDLDRDGLIDFTNSAGGDRITLSISELASRTVSGTPTPVRRSRSYVWNKNSFANDVLLTSSSESTLDGRRSWQSSFGEPETSMVTTVSPTTASRVVVTTAPSGATHTETSSYGRVVSTVDSLPDILARNTAIVYDAHGRVSSQTLSKGAALLTTTSFTYDPADRLLTRTEPTDDTANPTRTTTMTYDALGRVTTTTIQPGNKQSFVEYYSTGEVKRTYGFGITPVSYTYDSLGRMETLSTYKDFNPAGASTPAVTTWAYDDARGWMTRKTYQDTTHVDYAYSKNGRLQTRTWARGKTTTYSYTSAGEVSGVVYSDDTPDVIMAYDRMGRPETVRDAAGVRTLAYRDNGAPIFEEIGSTTPSENLLTGTRIDHAYTDRRRTLLTASAAPDGNGGYLQQSAAAYTYDTLDRIASVGRPGGATATYTYHPVFGSVSGANYTLPGTGSEVVYRNTRSYNKTGTLNGTVWDQRPPGGGMLWQPVHAWTHNYDAYGRRASTYERAINKIDMRWFHSYDDMGQLTGTYAQVNGTTNRLPGSSYNYTFDDIGNRKESAYGGNNFGNNQVNVSYASDDLNLYSDRTHSRSAAWITGHLPPGFPTSAEVLIGSTNNPPALANRLASPHDAWFWSALSFPNADPSVEEITIQTIPGTTTTFPMYIPKEAETFTYDPDGNLTSDSVWTYTWDGENRLKSMQMHDAVANVLLEGENPWMRLEFEYDYMNRRIAKRVISTLLTPQELADAIAGGTLHYPKSRWTRYLYDTGTFNLIMSYNTHWQTGVYQTADHSYLWGPDLSGSLTGAGGIGGMAITYNDGADQSSGGGPGAMLPAYDGNGNLTDLVAATPGGGGSDCGTNPVCPVASYEYGPFGEVRSMTGSQATANPMRWSTKFTDNETGLVYYGFRYYHAGLGRWMSRDPIGERDGANSLAYVTNHPHDNVDPFGLQKVRIAFNAFIHGKRGKVLSEPGQIPYLDVYEYGFGTDRRGFGQFNWFAGGRPNARLATMIELDLVDVGLLKYNRPSIRTADGLSKLYKRAWGSDDSKWRGIDAKAATPTVSTEIQDIDCETSIITVDASANYPFAVRNWPTINNLLAPNIDYDFTVTLKYNPNSNTVNISVSGSHNDFPDYELYIEDTNAPAGSLRYEYYSQYDGPGPWSLGVVWSYFSRSVAFPLEGASERCGCKKE